MTVGIQGIGWITPLGRNVGEVLDALLDGVRPPLSSIENPFTRRVHSVRGLGPDALADFRPPPRLRRSSLISHMAVAAAMDALADAGLAAPPERLALVFATTNGGVVYTRRFFAEVAKNGAHAGSPLLFPETVYNAPCSHVAAALNVTGTATTLVNDATAAIDAIEAAAALLDSGACDHCMVVAAEEADWITCEGYACWDPGLVLGEGAAALLLARDGGIGIHRPPPRAGFKSIPEGQAALAGMAARAMSGNPADGIWISPASGATADSLLASLPPSTLAPKLSLGEAFSASALLQIACAAAILRRDGGLAAVPVTGNGQVGAVALSLA